MNEKKSNPEFEFKRIEFKVDEAGKVSATIATFDVVDRDSDIVEKTAFTDGQEVPMVWSHNWDEPIGKGIIKVTPTEAVFEGAFFMNTERGMEAYKTVKAMGNLQEWSWGFHTTDSRKEPRDGKSVRHILETETYEVSPVLIGAGIGTRTLAIKGLKTLEADIKALLELTDSLGERLRSVKGLRKEEGREISEERRIEIKDLAKDLRKAADDLEESVNTKAAIGYRDTGTAAESASWQKPNLSDFTDKAWGDLDGAGKTRIADHFAWSSEMPPDNFGSLKLPHHVGRTSGIGKAVWAGVSAAMGALLGARGGVDIPEGDRKAVYNHLSKHYDQFDKEAPDFKSMAAINAQTPFAESAQGRKNRKEFNRYQLFRSRQNGVGKGN